MPFNKRSKGRTGFLKPTDRMASWVQNDWTRSLTKANQASIIGNSRPPNMASINPNMLQSASPKYFNLQQTTGVDTTPSDTAARSCRTTYKGFGGLRQLQQDQANRTYYDAGCGWRFNMGAGSGNPTINQAALGSYNGPVSGGVGDTDEVNGTTTWDMNLQRAERNACTSIATNLNNKCTNLQYLSAENQQFFGFCKSSGAIIPIQTDSAGNVTARYPSDITLSCPAANIIPATSAPGACPAVAAFKNYSRNQNPAQNAGANFRQGMGVRGDLREAFKSTGLDQKKKAGKSTLKENFTGQTLTSINDLSHCTSPLTEDCVILAARASGCGSEGSLIAALQNVPKGQAYNTNLQNNQAYLAYSQSANPGITSALLNDGSVPLATALNDFGNVVSNTQSSNPKIAAASRDLCIQSGYFQDSYDWCSDISPSTVIDSTNIACVQNNWRNQGGTPQGSSYPVIDTWRGKTFQTYLALVQGLLTNVNSTVKATQDAALTQFIGTASTYHDIQKTAYFNVIPIVTQANGSETVWIDLGDYWNGSTPPIILRCDLNMAQNGEVMPTMRADYTDLKNKYSLPSQEGMAFMNAFEYRTNTNTQLKFNVTVDDGFMIGINQNPFENTANAKNDWGSWTYQGPTAYTSPPFTMVADSPSTTNTVVTKYFQGQGQAIFIFLMNNGDGTWKDQSTDFSARANVYLTQEPLAPWLQFELCSRPNMGQGTKLGLFEKRWNGPAAFYENQGVNSPIPSFDTVSGSLVTQTDPNLTNSVPGGKGYLSFMPSSWWHTKAMFAFTAFSAITILIRISPTLSAGAGPNIFTHEDSSLTLEIANLAVYTPDGINYQFFNESMGVRQYVPCVVDQWNLVVIQYNGDAAGIRNVQMSAMDLPTLQTSAGLNRFFTQLSNKQNASGPVIAPPILNEGQRGRGAGYLILGGASPDIPQGRLGFTGDIAWLHGFRTPINTVEMLQAEVQQTWVSRWPRPNIDPGYGVSGFQNPIPTGIGLNRQAPGLIRNRKAPGSRKPTEGFFSGFKW